MKYHSMKMLKAITIRSLLSDHLYSDKIAKKGHFGHRTKWHNPDQPPNPRGMWGQLSIEAIARKALFYKKWPSREE
jgi:hypothetical protein